jgi:hypothetical protein
MSNSVKLGGERLGSGKKNKYITKTFNRSTHNLSYIWRSSMSAGTLVPFMTEVGLPGDTFDIDLNVDVKTLPTIGPLFGSYKVQLDIFEVPIRLYNADLHMNMLNLGREMNKVKLPLVKLKHKYQPADVFNDNSQINSSCIFSYLGIRGLGKTLDGVEGDIERKFNAVPYLGYWDIFKNYYANKQEDNAFVIHTTNKSTQFTVDASNQLINGQPLVPFVTVPAGEVVEFKFLYSNIDRVGDIDPRVARIQYKSGNDEYQNIFINDLFETFTHYTDDQNNRVLSCTDFKGLDPADLSEVTVWNNLDTLFTSTITKALDVTELVSFPLKNIDQNKINILGNAGSTKAYEYDDTSISPFGLPMKTENGEECLQGTQEGLAVKTYQSDKFNNWINTDWIDGTGGVSEVTAVDTSKGSFTIDALSLANKVYKMLNRINMSGGTYNDWINAVYSHDATRRQETPVYHGSLIKELAFEEVVSTAESETSSVEQPLGTLAGKGKLTGKHKGGKMVVKCHEPCYVMGIVSLTPRIDYSQGNKWDMNLQTLDDLHKPDLDQIGFQDLITDEMAWFDTFIDTANGMKKDYGSVGKVPAWLNYMTNVNRTFGNFADKNKEMFMTLNRNYEAVNALGQGIADLTTYIDPAKFNHIFADTNLDSQNFWTQISVNNTARRKMSAKVIPNL